MIVIRACRVFASGLMGFCAIGAVACAAARSLGGIAFYVVAFVIAGFLRSELVPR